MDLPQKYIQYHYLLHVIRSKHTGYIVPDFPVQAPIYLCTTMAVISGMSPSYAKSYRTSLLPTQPGNKAKNTVVATNEMLVASIRFKSRI